MNHSNIRIYVIKNSILNAMFYGIVFALAVLFVGVVGYLLLPATFKGIILNIKFIWVLIFIVIIYSLLVYKDFKKEHDILIATDKIYQCYREKAIIEFKVLYSLFETKSKIAEKKLDILKFFSPFPLLIYFLGLYIDNKSVLFKTIDIATYTIGINYILMYLGFGLIVLYLYSLIKVYLLYKEKFEIMQKFHEEIIRCEED